MTFKVNDQVMVTDEDLTGVIKKIEGNTISIETEDGFLLSFKSEELIKQHSDKSLKRQLFSNADIDSVIAEKELPKRKQPKRIPPKDRFEPTMEVDFSSSSSICFAKNELGTMINPNLILN